MEDETPLVDEATLAALGELEPGATVGPYRIEGLLGQGGTAVVYRATREGASFALKVMRPFVTEGAGGRRWRRELKLLSGLAHPNLVAVFDADEGGELPWFAMELVDGATVADRLAEVGPLAPDEALWLARELLGALSVLHARGIVHRDVKPANVMVTRRGVLKLMDLGVAHVGGATQLTRTGEVLGTPRYLPPEAFTGAPATPAFDVYAAGAMLYEALAGGDAHGGSCIFKLAQAKQRQDPPRLDVQRHDVPAPLADLVAWCLSRDASLRPVDARSALTLLGSVPPSAGPGRLASGRRGALPVRQPVTPPRVPAVVEPPGRRVVAVVAAVLAAATVAALAAWLLSSGPRALPWRELGLLAGPPSAGPLVVGGVLFVAEPGGRVVGFDAAAARTRAARGPVSPTWFFRPRDPTVGVCRGAVAWKDRLALVYQGPALQVLLVPAPGGTGAAASLLVTAPGTLDHAPALCERFLILSVTRPAGNQLILVDLTLLTVAHVVPLSGPTPWPFVGWGDLVFGSVPGVEPGPVFFGHSLERWQLWTFVARGARPRPPAFDAGRRCAYFATDAALWRLSVDAPLGAPRTVLSTLGDWELPLTGSLAAPYVDGDRLWVLRSEAAGRIVLDRLEATHPERAPVALSLPGAPPGAILGRQGERLVVWLGASLLLVEPELPSLEAVATLPSTPPAAPVLGPGFVGAVLRDGQVLLLE